MAAAWSDTFPLFANFSAFGNVQANRHPSCNPSPEASGDLYLLRLRSSTLFHHSIHQASNPNHPRLHYNTERGSQVSAQQPWKREKSCD
jgi:hypothetical protein